MVTKAEGAGEQTTDFSVDAFHFSTAQPGFVVAQYALSMAKQWGLGILAIKRRKRLLN